MTLVVSTLAVLGIGTPALAATLTATATSTGVIGTSGTNAFPITVSAPIITTGTSNTFNVQLRTTSGWTFVNGASSGATCPAWLSVSGMSVQNCSVEVLTNPARYIIRITAPSAIPAGTNASITFDSNSLNVTSGREFAVWYSYNSGVFIDSGTATLGAAPSTFSVSFNSNNGTGTMSDQTASASTPLTTNTFTQSGYTFSGWNTAADGSGTSYADGASFPFTANTTLYAQWTATLANTGINSATGISLLAGGLSLALVGAELFLIARRKRSS